MELLILNFDRSESLVLILIHFFCFCLLCDLKILISMIRVRIDKNKLNPAGTRLMRSGRASEFNKKQGNIRVLQILACQLLRFMV